MRISEWNVIHRTTTLILFRVLIICLVAFPHFQGISCATVSLIPIQLILPCLCLISLPHVSAIDPMDSMYITLPDADSGDRVSVCDTAVIKDNYHIDKDNHKTPTKFPCDAGTSSSSSSSGSRSDSSSGDDDSSGSSPISSPNNLRRFEKVLQHQ